MQRKPLFRTIVTSSIWSLVGVLLTIAFFYWTEYRNPFLFQIVLEDEFDLVEVKEKIDDLRIIFRGQDLLRSQRKIKVQTVTLQNEGKTILQQNYDQNQAFGLSLFGGTFLAAEPIASNSPYLLSNIIDTANVWSSRDTSDLAADLLFRKVIFENGKYVTLKLYVLQAFANQEPVLRPIGKIANIDSLSITRKEPAKEKEGPFPSSFSSLFAAALLAVLILTSLVSYIKYRRTTKRALAAIQKFESQHPALTDGQRAIIESFRSGITPIQYHLLDSISKGAIVADLRAVVNDIASRNIFVRMAAAVQPYKWRYMLFETLPEQIFQVHEYQVKINPEHKDFILGFFASIRDSFE